MREIKFRAYDPKKNEMIDNVPVVNGVALKWQYAPKDSGFVTLERDGRVENYYSDWDFLKEDHSLIPLQYTGLKDRNGVEIYEGDIVDCWDSFGFENITQQQIGEVSLNGGCFCVKALDGYHNRNALVCAENVEVIGNIHQNPELLERQQ